MTTPHLSKQELALLASGLADARAEAHLAGCKQCRAVWSEYRKVVSALHAAAAIEGEATVSPHFEFRLRKSLREQAGEGWSWPWVLAPLAACAVCAFLLWPTRPPSPVLEAKVTVPPTIWAYRQAAAVSEERLERLLDEHAATVLPPTSEAPRAHGGFAVAGL